MLPFSPFLSCDPLGESDHTNPPIPPSKKTRIVLSDRLVRRPHVHIATNRHIGHGHDTKQLSSKPPQTRFPCVNDWAAENVRSYSCSNNVPQVHLEYDSTSRRRPATEGSTGVASRATATLPHHDKLDIPTKRCSSPFKDHPQSTIGKAGVASETSR